MIVRLAREGNHIFYTIGLDTFWNINTTGKLG